MRHLRTSILAAVAGLTVLCIAPVANADSAQGVSSEERIAVVRVEFVQNGNRVTRIKAVRWGELARFEVVSGGHAHVVELRAEADGGSSKVDFKVLRDGSALATEAGQTIDLRHATNLFSDDSTQIRITITPTKVRVASH